MIVSYHGYKLYHCKAWAGIINHGYGASNAPQAACFYWQVRYKGKLVDTALTLTVAKERATQHNQAFWKSLK